jgi:hypothetical protein
MNQSFEQVFISCQVLMFYEKIIVQREPAEQATA